MNKLYQQASNLSNVFRFARLRLANNYSVSEHSFRVAILSMIIADDYNANVDHGDKFIDVELVLRKALMHDMEEATMGDVPGPVKRQFPNFERGYKAAAEVIMSEICDELDTDYLPYWSEAKEGISGMVVDTADKLESLYTTANELERSNYMEIEEAHRETLAFFETARGKVVQHLFPIVGSLINDGRFFDE